MFKNAFEPWHLVLIAVVLLVVFGSKKLPEAARGLGKSMRVLKTETRALRENEDGEHEADDTSGNQAAASADDEATETGGADEPTTGSTATTHPGKTTEAAETAETARPEPAEPGYARGQQHA